MLVHGIAYMTANGRAGRQGIVMGEESGVDRAADLVAGRERLAGLLGSDPSRSDVLTRYDRWAGDLWDGLAAV